MHYLNLLSSILLNYFFQSASAITNRSYSCLHQIMNFDKNTPIDSLIGQLLAFVIMFEKKIEQLKRKLAGNQQFHTRLAFQALDLNKQNEINQQNISNLLHKNSLSENQINCQLFIRRYSKNGALTYDEFLKLVTPKGNKTLSQRMLVRSFHKGAILQDYLYKILIDLIVLFVKMSGITQSLRIAIHQNEDLTHLDVIEFFHRTIVCPQSLVSFLQRSTQYGDQYDIDPSDAVYLSYHIQSSNDLQDFTDIDIKEILCPLDMNFQKPIYSGTFYKQSTFPREPQQQFSQTQTMNFLGKTYQKMYDKSKAPSNVKENVQKSYKRQDKYVIVNTNRQSSGIEKGSTNSQPYGNLYIDNFTKSQIDSGLQINQFISNNMFSKRQVQIFEDHLNSNSSSVSRQSRLSKESAFDRGER